MARQISRTQVTRQQIITARGGSCPVGWGAAPPSPVWVEHPADRDPKAVTVGEIVQCMYPRLKGRGPIRLLESNEVPIDD